MACTHRSVDVGRGLLLSSVACTNCLANVERGLAALSVACTHRSVDVRRVLPLSFVACTHQFADVGRDLPASSVACTCETRDVARGDIDRGLVDNMRMSMPYKKTKEFETPFMHNNIFIYFLLSILNVSTSRGSFVPIFINFTVRTILKYILFVQICTISIVSHF
jgi:hypothetical protein